MDHAARMARFAAACVAAAAATPVRRDRPDGAAVRIRVGLASGPTTAVVVGRKSPKYTLLGDTVNIARLGHMLEFSRAGHPAEAVDGLFWGGVG